MVIKLSRQSSDAAIVERRQDFEPDKAVRGRPREFDFALLDQTVCQQGSPKVSR